MNVEIGNEAVQFPEKEYINGIFVEVQERGDNSSSQVTSNINMQQKIIFCWFTY